MSLGPQALPEAREPPTYGRGYAAMIEGSQSLITVNVVWWIARFPCHEHRVEPGDMAEC